MEAEMTRAQWDRLWEDLDTLRPINWPAVKAFIEDRVNKQTRLPLLGPIGHKTYLEVEIVCAGCGSRYGLGTIHICMGKK